MITAIVLACYVGVADCRKPTDACAVNPTSRVCLDRGKR